MPENINKPEEVPGADFAPNIPSSVPDVPVAPAVSGEGSNRSGGDGSIPANDVGQPQSQDLAAPTVPDLETPEGKLAMQNMLDEDAKAAGTAPPSGTTTEDDEDDVEDDEEEAEEQLPTLENHALLGVEAQLRREAQERKLVVDAEKLAKEKEKVADENRASAGDLQPEDFDGKLINVTLTLKVLHSKGSDPLSNKDPKHPTKPDEDLGSYISTYTGVNRGLQGDPPSVILDITRGRREKIAIPLSRIEDIEFADSPSPRRIAAPLEKTTSV